MSNSSTEVKDRNGKMICAGDTIVCDAPIYVKPKTFVVKWDELLKRYNLPTDKEILSHCEVVC